MDHDFDARLMADARARAKTAEAENARLKSRLAELEARVQSEDNPKDKPPGVPAEDDDELDENGKPKKRKTKADDKPADEQGCDDKPRTEDDEEARSKAAALLMINAYRRAVGQKPIAKLIQDESAIPAGLVIDPRDSETLARAVVAANRRALNLPQLKPGEFISIAALRGES